MTEQTVYYWPGEDIKFETNTDTKLPVACRMPKQLLLDWIPVSEATLIDSEIYLGVMSNGVVLEVQYYKDSNYFYDYWNEANRDPVDITHIAEVKQ